MSDYLWDGKGEPDADVARLEELLGAFKHAPRPLALPAEATAPGPRPSGLLPFVSRLRASRLFAPAALAAAALLVASIVVASALLRARRVERTAPRAAEQAMLEPPPPVGGVKDERAAVEVKDEKVRDEKARDVKVAVESFAGEPRARKGVQLAAVPRRRQKVLTAGPAADVPGAGRGSNLEAMRAGFNGSALVESTRLLTKEQLVYALRLTGAKLKDVRERAHGTMNDER